MKPERVRKKFIKYFEKRNHKIISSCSLLSDDSSVLLTTAGMQQFKDYFTGKKNPKRDFNNLNTVSIQKCFRTSDIEQIGDESHLTFFEMMGNFSFGGYFKEDAIQYAYDFIVNTMKLEIDYVTVFDPEKVLDNDWRGGVPFDKKSYDIFRNKIKLPESKIKRRGIDNFWGPTGLNGPCGPTVEIYVKGIEVWNIVFNEYYFNEENKLEKLKKPGIDTGLGFERLVVFAQGVKNIFETDLFQKPFGNLFNKKDVESTRIVADHVRGSVFLLSDGVLPSNKGAGYILRRLIRRLMIHSKRINLSNEEIKTYIKNVIKYYNNIYSELKKNQSFILKEFFNEVENFEEILHKGIKEFNKLYPIENKSVEKISDEDAFNLFQSYGFPLELIRELTKERNYKFDEEEFNKRFIKHQKISKIGAEKKFGGHGLNGDNNSSVDGEEKAKIIKLHTATHLLNQAINDILGDTRQEGSNINFERARFDFKSNRKLTDEELDQIEDVINQKIKENLPVNKVEMNKKEAEKTGALHFFKNKYPDRVTIYYIGSSLEKAYSKEFCAGPHVKEIGELGKFKIIKQKSVGKNIKRIKVTVEN